MIERLHLSEERIDHENQVYCGSEKNKTEGYGNGV
jgi:hypothetical protein